MDEVLIEVNGVPTFHLPLCDIDLVCFFHEANVSERSFGHNIVRIYEDFSHNWGMVWNPIFNEKFVHNFGEMLISYQREYGVNPPVRDLATYICSSDLEKEVMKPQSRKYFQKAIENNGGYMSKVNRGFVHYMVFDDLLQSLQDAFSSRGIVI